MGFISAARTALNYAKFFLKYGTYSYDSDALKKVSGEERAKLAKEYSESVGLGPQSIAEQAFTDYAKSRINSVDKFKTVKVGEKNLSDLLTVTSATAPTKVTAIESVRDKISAALHFSEKIDNKGEHPGARQKFEKDLADLKACLADPEFKYLPQTLISYTHEIIGNAVAAIKKQQSDEVDALKRQFANSGFNSTMKTAMGLAATQDDELTAIQKDMLKALTDDHKEQIAKFESSVNDPLIKMHNSSKERVAFLAMLDQIDQNKAAIDKLVLRGGGNLAAAQGQARRIHSGRFKDVDVGDLKEIMTVTGRKITKDGESSYTLALPNRLLRPDFYASSSNNRKQAIMAIPLALKARGFTSVTMTINHPNKEYAKELAREAYEACREAGFDTKDIKIEMNGEVFSDEKEPGTIKSKLFDDCPTRFDAADVQAAKNAEDWNNGAQEIDGPDATTEFREYMSDFREKQIEAEDLARIESEAAAASPQIPV